MASTFGGISTAHSGLVAARLALDVAGQNIANATTRGYTRQRVELAPVSPLGRIGLFASSLPLVGNGVGVTEIARLGNALLEARATRSAADASFADVRARALEALDRGLGEPGGMGLSSTLQRFHASWQDLANSPDGAAAGAVVLERGAAIAGQLAAAYTTATQQWESTRTSVDALAGQLNGAASQVAELNNVIRSTLAAGGQANELIDRRGVLLARIAELTGGTAQARDDGTVDVLVGGNALIRGTNARAVSAVGGYVMDAGPVTLEWSDRPGSSIGAQSGSLAGALSLLAPSTPGGGGGAIAELGAVYSAMAISLAEQVNALHTAGATRDGTTGLAFFALDLALPPALGLSVVPTTSAGLAAAAPGAGALDGSVADAISQLALSPGSAGAIWGNAVARFAVTTRTAIEQSTIADLAAGTAAAQLLSETSVDLDEENIGIVMSQTAYQAAARALTAMDEMLDTLINRTGIVGR